MLSLCSAGFQQSTSEIKVGCSQDCEIYNVSMSSWCAFGVCSLSNIKEKEQVTIAECKCIQNLIQFLGIKTHYLHKRRDYLVASVACCASFV